MAKTNAYHKSPVMIEQVEVNEEKYLYSKYDANGQDLFSLDLDIYVCRKRYQVWRRSKARLR
jgi:hypothetical protein